MSQRLRNGKTLLPSVALRPVSVDHVAAVRYVHAEATRTCAAHYLNESDAENLAGAINSEEYIHSIVKGGLTGAWVGPELVGTVGWKTVSAAPKSARLHMLFVWPMFARAGIGRLLVAHAEAQAHAAGIRSVRARATGHQAAFFKRLGYVVTAQSALRTASGGRMPIAYLRKDQICPEFPFAESEWGGAGRYYRH